MSFFFVEYLNVFFFIVYAGLFSLVLFCVSFFVSSSNAYAEKLSAYECGFDPFEDARSQFDVRFYLVAILFLIFDIEASFLFPWSVTLGNEGSFVFWAMFDFFIELIVGFFYAWKVGALEWLVLRGGVIGYLVRLITLKL